MTIEQLRRAIRAQPFRPFMISLADGRRFRVRHPDFVLIGPEAGRTFVVVEKGEDYSVLDVFLVTSIDFSNGRPVARPRRVR